MYENWQALENDWKTYPNLFNKTLPFFVGCAKQEMVDETKMAFERVCPKDFIIKNVTWERSRTKPHCIWRVEYQLTGLTLLPKEGDELKEYFKILEKHHPQNAAIVNVQRSINAVIYYGVICECSQPNFEVFVQRPVQHSLGTLQETMANMKIESM